MLKIIFIVIVLIFIFLKIKFRNKTNNIITIYFGVPGAGKTTIAAHLCRKDLKKNKKVWSNVPITGAYMFEPQTDICKYMLDDGRIIIDEAGIEYNNREFKTFSKDSTYFYKYHRHYKLDIDFFSQGWNDCDKKIRDLAQRFYIVKPSILPCFIYRRRINRKIGINEMTGEIQDVYFFVPFGRNYYFAPAVWGMFNTLSCRKFPDKDWKKW